MNYTWDFSETNDEGSLLTGFGIFAYQYLLGGAALHPALGLSILGALGVLGVTGISSTAASATTTATATQPKA